jgi:hypothetical protein
MELRKARQRSRRCLALRTNSRETIRFPLSGENRAGNHFGGHRAGNHSGGHRAGGRRYRNAALRPRQAFSRIPAPRRGPGRSIHPPRRNPVLDTRAASSPAVRARRNRYRLISEGPPKRSPPEEPLLTLFFSSACSLRHKGKQVACQTASHLFRSSYDGRA